MIDISAFVNDPELRPALIGLIGVGVGGLMTVTGQSITRRAERLHAMRQEVAQVMGLSHMIRSLYVAYHADGKAPEAVKDRYLKQLNADRPEMLKMCQLLMITAPRSISVAARALAETVTAADNYTHPATGEGKGERFKNTLHYGMCISHAEVVLGKVARSYWWFRWPCLWLNIRNMPRLETTESPVTSI
uniref:hypothetical protein n=1 Tax=Arthrobacter sp. TaxID=1667 RepID=UPI00159EE14D|nr:hypothetical protein [Arthrobacter sp.]